LYLDRVTAEEAVSLEAYEKDRFMLEIVGRQTEIRRLMLPLREGHAAYKKAGSIARTLPKDHRLRIIYTQAMDENGDEYFAFEDYAAELRLLKSLQSALQSSLATERALMVSSPS
jgi:hypothetical protein